MMSAGKTMAIMTLAAVTAIGGCSDSDNELGGGGADLRVLLTDAPSDYIASAEVTFSRVYLKGGSDDVDLLADEEIPVTYDLMQLRDGITALLAGATIPEGSYRQLRMVVDSAVVTLADGVTFDDGSNNATLFVPSGMQSGIKVLLRGPIEAEDGSLTVVVIDFDVDDNFVIQGDPTVPDGVNGVLFTPVLNERSRTPS